MYETHTRPVSLEQTAVVARSAVNLECRHERAVALRIAPPSVDFFGKILRRNPIVAFGFKDFDELLVKSGHDPVSARRLV